MRLIVEKFAGSGAVSVAEDQPLPPNDRISPPRRDTALALSRLYRTQAPRLMRLFSRQAGIQDAEDLVQDSFVRLTKTSTLEAATIDCPEAYLTRIASNLLHDRAKNAFQRARSSQVPIDEVTITGPDPIASLEARDVVNRLNLAIQQLSPTTQEVFMAHRLEGLSHVDIAARTGISTASVARHMTKAIAHIQRALGSR